MTVIKKMKEVLAYVDKTSKGARIITYSGLILTCLLLTAALVLRIFAGELSAYTFGIYHIVDELVSDGWLVLLISTLGANRS